ncbi:hypothetical protein [Streptacidiphilus carbonis]|uniref:hypothetical protein n=1 Tax=Streptacidiphilus carbonis TaxID=105422 RepID=UPI0005A6A056|nr:hypothetical protein [Streptacidiphilus carbonis]
MMPAQQLEGTTTVGTPPSIFSGDDATTHPRTAYARYSTPVADLPKPFSAGLIRFTKPRKGSVLSCAWVAAYPGAEPVLMVGYDGTRIGRDLVEAIIHDRYGIPDEVIEVSM